jgi:hypothetical protein
MLVLSLPLLGEFEPKSVLEDFADRLLRHALDVGVEEDDKQPAEEADAAVKSKCSGRCDTFHHGKESAADDDVGAPATAKCVSKGIVPVPFRSITTYVTVLSIVPSALASFGINSVPIQAIVATPVE